jgi:hypothetical protein
MAMSKSTQTALATVRDSEIDTVIGSLHNMDTVDLALSHTLGLP